MSRPDVGLVGLKGPPGSVPSDSNDDCMKGAPKWAPFLQTSGLLVILEATPKRRLHFGHQPKY